MSDSYAKQKFSEAVSALIGPAPLKQRLRFALSPLITLRASGSTNQHLPEALSCGSRN
jgi:hypothetical protein